MFGAPLAHGLRNPRTLEFRGVLILKILKTKRILTVSVVALLALMLAGVVPAAAAIHETWDTPPVLTVTSNMPFSVACTPDGYTNAPLTVDVSHQGGYNHISAVVVELYDGNGVFRQTPSMGTPTYPDANTNHYASNFEFDYSWPAMNSYYAKVIVTADSVPTTFRFDGIIYLPAIGLTVETASVAFGTLPWGSASAPRSAAYHNSANTVIKLTDAAPDWTSSTGGTVVPINTLTANGTAISNAGVVVVPNVAVGSGVQTMPFVMHSPAFNVNTHGPYQTDVSVTAAAV